MKKIVSLILALSMFMSFGITSYAANKEAHQPDVYFNGEMIEFPDQPTQIVDGRTMVPVRGFFEYLGCKVDWSEEEQLVTLSGENGSFYIFMAIGYPGLIVYDGEDEYTGQLDVVPQIINDRTMVPMSFISKLLGYDVTWDEEAYCVNVKSPNVIVAQKSDVSISDLFLAMMNATENGSKEEKDDEESNRIVNVSLSYEGNGLKKDDELVVYVEADGLEDDMLSAVIADFVYDKTALEYIAGSAAVIDAEEKAQTNFMFEETDGEKGVQIFAMPEDSVKNPAKKIMIAKFKVLADGDASVSLGNVFHPSSGYSTQIMLETSEGKDVLYEGKTLNIVSADGEK